MMKISLIHASYRSGQNSKTIRDIWLERAKFPEEVEHCVSFESKDIETINVYTDTLQIQGLSTDLKSKYYINSKQYENKSSAVDNWNLAASISTGDVLFVISDDTVPDDDWDETLRKICGQQNHKEFCLKISDNRCVPSQDREIDGLLPRHPVVSREYYSNVGFIFDPIFSGAGADDQLLHSLILSKKIVDAREFRIHHAKGNILNNLNEIQCGCSEKQSDKPKLRNYSQSQISKSSLGMHFFIKNWGIAWTIVHILAMSPEYSQDILYVMNKRRSNKGAIFLSFLLLKILINPHQTIKLLKRIPKGTYYLLSIK